jgi:hypothetical protein
MYLFVLNGSGMTTIYGCIEQEERSNGGQPRADQPDFAVISPARSTRGNPPFLRSSVPYVQSSGWLFGDGQKISMMDREQPNRIDGLAGQALRPSNR